MKGSSIKVPRAKIERAFFSIIVLTTGTIVLNSSAGVAEESSANSQNTAIKGNVQRQALAAEAGIKELEETSKYLRRGAIDMIGEVERQNYVSVGSPDVIGSMVIPAFPSATGTIATGEMLPARSKWVGFYLSEISQAVAALKQEFNAIAIPEEKAQTLAQSMSELKALFSDVQTHFQNLKIVTQGPTYENLKIGKAALAIYDDTKPIEELLKKAFHLLKEKS